MDTLIPWLPKIGACLVILFGLVGFFKPHALLSNMNIGLGSNVAISEARGVFGGMNIGTGSAALYFSDPTVFTLLGYTWLCVLAARPYSMLVDGTSLKDSVAPIVVDLTIAVLFLSHLFLPGS